MNRRKQWIAGLLAALLLLSLAACKKETPPQEPTEEPPAVDTPDTPQEPEEPKNPTPPEDPEPPADEPTENTGAEVTDLSVDGSVEETVSYQLVRPEIHTGSDSVDQILNDYYQSVYGKLTDYAWGEVYEQAMEAHSTIHMDAGYQVMRNDGQHLSIYRTVSLTYYPTDSNPDLDQGAIPIVTAYAETFDLATGGLLTAQDFFDADEDTYSQRLTDCVKQQIQEDPYHDQTYFAQWEDMTVRAFNKDQFYLTEDAYVVFYQENQLGGAAETVYPIPWSRLEDILKS